MSTIKDIIPQISPTKASILQTIWVLVGKVNLRHKHVSQESEHGTVVPLQHAVRWQNFCAKVPDINYSRLRL